MATYGVDQIQLPVRPLKSLKSHGVGIVVQRQRSLHAPLHDEQALGAELVGQDLDGVADEQAGPGHGVHDVEDPDEGDHGVVGARGAVLLVQGGGERPEDEGDEHAGRGGDEGWAATEFVDEHGHADGDDEGEGGDAGRELGINISTGESKNGRDMSLTPSLVVELVMPTP